MSNYLIIVPTTAEDPGSQAETVKAALVRLGLPDGHQFSIAAVAGSGPATILELPDEEPVDDGGLFRVTERLATELLNLTCVTGGPGLPLDVRPGFRLLEGVAPRG